MPEQSIITLAFHDLFQLWAFAREIGIRSIYINSEKKTITCECRETDISIAHEKYGAKLLEHSETSVLN